MGIARKSILGLGGQVYMLVIGLASTIIVARLLGPEGKGVLAIVAAIPSLAMGVASFGLGPALAYMSGKNLYPARDLVSAATIWSLFLAALLGSLVWLLRDALLDSILRGLSPQDLAMSLFALPAVYLSTFLGALFIGHDRAVAFAALQSISASLNFAAVIGASLLFPGDSSAMVVALTVGSWLGALCSLTVYRAGFNLSPRCVIQVTRSATPYAAKSYVGQATSMFFLRADVFFLNYFAGPYAVGVYSVATNLAEKLWLLSNPVSSAVYSQITGAERGDALRLTTLTARALLVLNGAAALMLFVLSLIFVPLVYGAQFGAATLYLALLLPGVVVTAVCQPYVHFVGGQLGRPGATSKISAAMMGLSAMLYAALIPPLGAAGAALGSTFSYSAALIGYGWLIPGVANVNLREMFVPTAADFQLYRSIAQSSVARIRRRAHRG